MHIFFPQEFEFLDGARTTLAALHYPDIDPILIKIGPLAIRWYALAYIAGLLLGWRYVLYLARNTALWKTPDPAGTVAGKKASAPATANDIDDLLFWATLGVIVGGRLGYVLFYQPSIFLHDPLHLFAVWQGGMSFHGGFLGVVLAGLFFCRRRALNPLSVGDLMAAAVPIGLFFGRIANFINGELWGKPTDAPWGMVFAHVDSLPRHPSQLYEASLEGLVMFAILWVATHKFYSLSRPGRTMGIFIAGYGFARVIVEFFRQPDSQIGYLADSFLTMGMMLSVPMILVGMGFIWRSLPGAPAWLHPSAAPNQSPEKPPEKQTE